MSTKKIYLKELEAIHVDGRSSKINVFLSSRKTTTKNFRCVNCGNLLFQYVADVPLISETDSPDDQSNLEIVCERCKTKYRILW